MTADEVLAQIRASDKPHYVYVLSRPCGTPFYVGIGTGRRVLDHVIFAKRPNGKSRKISIIRKIWRDGGEVGYSLHGWFDVRKDAERAEAELIAHYGRADLGTGPLSNGTDGGEGASGISDEGRSNKSAKAKAAWQNEDYRSVVLSAFHSPEAQSKGAASRLGQIRGSYNWTKKPGLNSPELRAAQSERLKADPVSRRPGVAAKISASKRGKSVPNHWTKDPSKVWTRGEHPRAVPVELDGKTFACIMDAAEHFGVERNTIARWLKNPTAPRRRWPERIAT